jgi:hypothetical protein
MAFTQSLLRRAIVGRAIAALLLGALLAVVALALAPAASAAAGPAPDPVPGVGPEPDPDPRVPAPAPAPPVQVAPPAPVEVAPAAPVQPVTTTPARTPPQAPVRRSPARPAAEKPLAKRRPTVEVLGVRAVLPPLVRTPAPAEDTHRSLLLAALGLLAFALASGSFVNLVRKTSPG